jgi:hypothetical protein
MGRCLAFIVLFAGLAAPASAEEKPVRADLNGDGAVETVMLEQSPASIVVRVHLGGRSANAQQLEFGVDPTRQDAVCSLPADLEVISLDCEPKGDPLPGCKMSNSAKALLISDGECEPIHLYWDHEAGKLTWWRL